MEEIKRYLDKHHKRLERIEHQLFGNGTAGMDEMVRKHEGLFTEMQEHLAGFHNKLDKIHVKMTELHEENVRDKARKEGTVLTLKWVRWGVIFLAVLLGLIGGSTLQTQTDILDQIRNFPALP